MTYIDTKSQTSGCEAVRRKYRDIDFKIRRKNDRLADINNDWRAAATQKLSAGEVERALLTGALNALVDQKQRLKAEITKLEIERDNLRNDYNLRKCPAMIGSIE